MAFLYGEKKAEKKRKLINANNQKENVQILILVVFMILVVVWGIVSKYFFQINFVSGNSMENTLGNDAIVLTDRDTDDIKRYDIVIVKFDNTVAVKRVIGLPMEVVSLEDGYVFIDGEKDCKYPFYTVGKNGEKNTLWETNEKEYFLLGDNRAESFDSRNYGCVKRENIIGVVRKIIWKGR